jgi:hypothetical protein
MAPQGVLDYLDLPIVAYPAQRLRRTQKAVFQRNGIIVERPVGPDVVRRGMVSFQETGQPAFPDHPAHLAGDLLRVSREIVQLLHVVRRLPLFSVVIAAASG